MLRSTSAAEAPIKIAKKTQHFILMVADTISVVCECIPSRYSSGQPKIFPGMGYMILRVLSVRKRDSIPCRISIPFDAN
jgi:hypothetical protein